MNENYQELLETIMELKFVKHDYEILIAYIKKQHEERGYINSGDLVEFIEVLQGGKGNE